MSTRTIQPYRRAQPVLYHDLVETRTYLQKLRAEQPRVAANFDAWVKHRRLTIDTVDRLHQKIIDVSVGSNVAKSVGAVAGIGGALAGLVGFILEVNDDKETAEKFYTASKYCAGASLVTVAASAALEMGLTQSALNEIKSVLRRDIELTKPLRGWIQFSHDIDDRFERLFQCDIFSETFTSVFKVCRHCIRLLDSGSLSIQDLIYSLSRLKVEGIENLTMDISEKVIHFFRGLLNSPELRQPLVDIWNIINENPNTLELAKVGVTIYYKTIDLLKCEDTIYGLLATVGLQLPLVPLPHCALNVISLASNVVSLILAVENIKKGTSKYSESLENVRMVLSAELREVSKQMRAYTKSDYGTNFELDFAKLAIL